MMSIAFFTYALRMGSKMFQRWISIRAFSLLMVAEMDVVVGH
jgi:hypothetical protein